MHIVFLKTPIGSFCPEASIEWDLNPGPETSMVAKTQTDCC